MNEIIIVDDHEIVREGLKKILVRHKDIRIIGEANDIAGTLELLKSHQPSVLLLDLSLDRADELQGFREVRASFPAIPVLVLSAYPEEHFAVRVLKEGASGYINKATAVEEIVEAIRKIAIGGRYISQSVANILVQELSDRESFAPHEVLSARELEILRMLGSGIQIKQAAAELGVSVSSINTYRSRIFKKMNLFSNAALIRYAVKQGLVN
jgi:two-component system invasion response regulator UvrY